MDLVETATPVKFIAVFAKDTEVVGRTVFPAGSDGFQPVCSILLLIVRMTPGKKFEDLCYRFSGGLIQHFVVAGCVSANEEAFCLKGMRDWCCRVQ